MIRLVSILIIIVLVYLLISQVTIPILIGKPLLPIFRKKRNENIERLAEAKAEIEDLQIQEKAAKTELSVAEKKAQVNKLESELNKESEDVKE